MNARKKSETEDRVQSVIRAFLEEVGNAPAISLVSLDASIEDDLSIDSIGRAEILRLLEKAFAISISDQALLQAETLRDIVEVVQAATPSQAKSAESASLVSGELNIPKSTHTLLQVLEYHVGLDEKKVHIYLQEETDQVNEITYGRLHKEAQCVAKGLYELGIGKGETVAIMLPTCEDFFYAFIGILYAGAIPVPIYPPFRVSDIERYVKNEEKILNNAEVRALITFEKGKAVSRIIKSLIPTLKKVTTVDELRISTKVLPSIVVKADDPVLIQYTSGSTGDPKGVLLQHRNLLKNLRAIGEKIKVNKSDVIVSWLPLYHDMGLIGAWLGSLYYGIPLVLHSPLAFLTHPEKWLWSIHRYRGTISASPNFGYELCNNKINEEMITGLDLSSWRLALNGAEAVYPNTVRQFIEKFKPYYFNPKAIYPVYGLAESTVALALPDLESELCIEKINREIFSDACLAQLVSDSSQDYLEFVSCGRPLSEHEVRIVDDKDAVLSERKVGHIQFRGPSAMQGYYHNPKAVNDAYHDGWWDTGDMGYIANDNLFPTGRQKDLIIKAGHNIYPSDIESAVNELAGIRKGGVVVFGVTEEKSGTEKVIVVAEVYDHKIKEETQLISQVIKKVKEAIGMPPDHVVLVPPKTIPKTSSGKLRRSTAKTMYIKNQLKPESIPVWFQLSKLVFKGMVQTVSRWVTSLLRFLYTLYVGLLSLLLLLPLWVLLFVLPAGARAKLAKVVARVMIFLMACPLKVTGLEHIPRDKQIVFASNHTSFFDTLVLQAVLPAGCLFLAKTELLKVPLLKSFIKRLGHLVITREDFRQGEHEMKQISQAIRQGKSLVIYPEGTFTYARGVQRFKLGAFTIAAENDLLICPVALRGVRDVLRGEEWLLRPGKVSVTIEESIDPAETEWRVLSHLRDYVRDLIAKHSGEEKLG